MPGALNGLGQINFSLRKYDDAENYLIKAAPNTPNAWDELARLYLLEHKFEQAETWAQKIVGTNQGDALANEMLDAAKARNLSDDLRRRIEPMLERDVNKTIGEFPGADFSSPEAACAAWERSIARMDYTALDQMSLAPQDTNRWINWFAEERQRNADSMGSYLNAQIVAVQIWRDDLANVIVFVPFPPETNDRWRYGTEVFGRVNGSWKHWSATRQLDPTSAKASFRQNKAVLWQAFTNTEAQWQSQH